MAITLGYHEGSWTGEGTRGEARRIGSTTPCAETTGESDMSKVWLVTGAGSGFGRAFTEAAVGQGDVVVATARRPEALAGLVAAHPDQVEALALDVTDPAGVGSVVADVVERHGRIDVLVNNAGRTHVGAAEETTDAELRSLFDLHFFGPAALVRAVLPHMRERRSGAIVQM